MENMLGTLICALGGLCGAVFSLPLNSARTKTWAYESRWLVYAVFGLVLFPWALAAATVPNLCDVLHQTPAKTLLQCFAFGALWGIGGLTWGLMIRYLGVGLGLALGCGLCSATGTLIPPIVQGRAADLVKDTAAIVTLVSVAVSLAGIVLVGMAGKLKEGELDEEAKKKAVAEFDFKKGLIVALIAGVASAGMNFGLQSGAEIEAAVGGKWAGMPVLVVVLAGGFVVNAAWCLVENAKNGTFKDYAAIAKPSSAGVVCFAGLAGVIWACQFACQKVGEPMMGEMAYISFAVVMGSCVLFSSLVGILLGEWNGTGRKTKTCLAAGLVVLAISILVAVAAKQL